MEAWQLKSFLKLQQSCLVSHSTIWETIECISRLLDSLQQMEPVGLALGIIPLVGGSLKVYKSTYSRLKTFRHYSREVDRVRKNFDRQRHFFLNEVHLVLRLVLEDESLVQDMIDDGAHKKWKSSSLEDSMADRLGNNAQSLKDIIEDIGTIIGDVEKGLECFSGLDKERLEVS